MCGIIREGQYVDYIISPDRIKPSSIAMVVRPQWIDILIYEGLCGLPPDYMICTVARGRPRIRERLSVLHNALASTLKLMLDAKGNALPNRSARTGPHG
jgi:hypothetical protein